MKKIYLTFIVTAALSAMTAHAQQDRENSNTVFSASEYGEKIKNVETRTDAPEQRGTVLVCDSLFIENNGGNGFNGNMFDVVVTTTCILETFSVSFDIGTWNVAIYYRPGSYAGFNTSSTGWIFLDSASITSLATNDTTLYKVPVNLSFPLVAGNTYGFYVTGTAPSSGINYTDGTMVGAVAASNAYFSVRQGHGGAYPFSVTNSPRVFNGEAYYCVDVTEVDETEAINFNLYPNPADETVTMDLSSFEGKKLNLTMINALGQVIYNQNIQNTSEYMLNVSNYPAGLYLIQIESDGKVSTARLTVK